MSLVDTPWGPQTIEPFDYHTPCCGTVMRLVRAEPHCLSGGDHSHPDQWHLEMVSTNAQTCESCDTWVEPVRMCRARNDGTVVLYPREFDTLTARRINNR